MGSDPDPGDGSDAAAASAERLLRTFIDETWNRGEFGGLAEQLAPGLMVHAGGRDVPVGVDAMIAMALRFRTAFADFQWRVDEAVARGGTVAMRTTFSGTMTGTFDGHRPNGRSMRVAFLLFAHVRDGRIQELWEEYDAAGMRRQLGLEG